MAQKIRKTVAILLMFMLMVGPSPAIPVTGALLTPAALKHYFPLVSSPIEMLAIGPDGGGVTPVLFDPKNPSTGLCRHLGRGRV